MIARLCVACLLVAEALALYAVAEFIANGYSTDPHAVSAWAFIIAVGAAYLLPRVASSLFASERNARIAITVAAVIIIYALLRTQFGHDLEIWNFGWLADFLNKPADTFNRGSHAMIGFMFILCAWLWGAYRSNDDIEPELVARTIAAPFIVVTILVVIGAGTHRAGEIGRASVGFYVFDVLALVLSQLTLSGATLGNVRTGGVVATLMGGTVAAVVAGVLVVTIVFAVIGPLIGPSLGDFLGRVLTWVLTPFAWVLEQIFKLLLGGHGFPKLTQNDVQPSPAQPQHPGGQPAGERIGLYALRAVGLVVLLALIVGVIALVAHLRRRSRGSGPATTVVASAGNLGDDVGDLLRRIFRRPPRIHAPADDAATRLYLEVLHEAEKRGAARPPSVTATEFVEPLRRTFPSAATEEITAAFEQARYAGRQPDEQALQRLRDRWQQAR